MPTHEGIALRDRVRMERVRVLYEDSITPLVSVVIVGFVFVVMFWDSQPHTILLGWYGSMIVLSVLRGFATYMFFRVSPDKDTVDRWAWLLAFGALLSGLLWGALPWLMLDVTSVFNTLAIMLTLFALTAGALGSNAVFLPAYFAFAIPTILLLVARLASEGGGFVFLGGLMLLFLVVFLGYSIRHSRLIGDSIRQRFENLELMKDLEAKKLEAEKSNADKSRFLAAASHDLRQPLQAMRLYLDALAGQIREPAAQGVVGRINTMHEEVSGLLDRLLHISEMDVGQVNPQNEIFDITLLVSDMHEQYHSQAESLGLDWRLYLPAESLPVHSDAIYVRELLGNLISNALRYTERGGVLLAVRMRGSNVRVEVWDTGCGIEAASQERIFHELVQLGNPERDRGKGVGLGLSIASRLARLLGTRIGLASRPGRGSMFSFELPLSDEVLPVLAKASETVLQYQFHGSSVFVIEDDPQVRESLGLLLRQWHCDVKCFADREAALVGMRGQDHLPSAIISDYRMPGQATGIDIVCALRAEAGEDIPALLLTGETDDATCKAALEAGIPLLHKPLSARRLGQFLEQYLSGG